MCSSMIIIPLPLSEETCGRFFCLLFPSRVLCIFKEMSYLSFSWVRLWLGAGGILWWNQSLRVDDFLLRNSWCRFSAVRWKIFDRSWGILVLRPIVRIQISSQLGLSCRPCATCFCESTHCKYGFAPCSLLNFLF